MNVLTACSGIGAPEHAWRDLPFNFIGCSEIEAFPSAVLKHHYPNVTNYGDMNNYREWKIDEPITALFAGTPCQSFSVAGLRQGMDSPNGNLALVYLGMVEKFKPRWVIWENVPGVLSSNGGRDFGAFLGALGQLGYSYAYRVLDAQYFGVPQRRRRVFVVGHRGNWRCAAAVLFEPKGLRRDIKKSGKAGKDIAPTVVCGPPYSRTGNQRVEAEALVLQVYENHPMDSRVKAVEKSPTLSARWGTGGGNTPIALNRMRGFGDYKDATDLVLWRQTTPTDYKADTVTGTLMTQMSKRATDILAVHENTRSELRLTKEHPPLTTGGGKPGQGYPCIIQERARRIMPSEAELLQGFPKGYTDITYRGKAAPDSQRYKALGNSMAVPVVRWIGKRIAEVEKANA